MIGRAAGAVVAVLAVGLLACAADDPAPPRGDGLSPHWAAFPPEAAERATVVRVIDGDTFVAVVGGRTATIRLFGVDTPERDERCYAAARDWLSQRLPTGAHAWLQPGPRNDDGQRLLRYAFTEDGAVLLDAALVAEGLGEAWRRDGQVRDAIVMLEAEARASGAGCLWGGRG